MWITFAFVLESGPDILFGTISFNPLSNPIRQVLQSTEYTQETAEKFRIDVYHSVFP